MIRETLSAKPIMSRVNRKIGQLRVAHMLMIFLKRSLVLNQTISHTHHAMSTSTTECFENTRLWYASATASYEGASPHVLGPSVIAIMVAKASLRMIRLQQILIHLTQVQIFESNVLSF